MQLGDSTSSKKAPYFSSYDPSIFYTPMYTESSKVTKPIRNQVTEPIKLTVTLKDIGLEGLDSPSPDKAYNIRKRKQQRRQEKLRRSQRSNPSQSKTVSPPTIQPPLISPRMKKIFGQSAKLTPIYEGTFYKNRAQNPTDLNDPKPIGLLSASQKPQKPQPIIPKTSPRGSPRLNTSGSGNNSGVFNAVEKDTSDHPIENSFNGIAGALTQEDNKEENTENLLEKLLENTQEDQEDSIDQSEAPLEPTYLIEVKEDRNQCYDNICVNIDRGMPGNPLEKELEEQEAREAAELEEKLSLKPLGILFGSKQDNGEEQNTAEREENNGQDEDRIATRPLENLFEGALDGIIEKVEEPLEPSCLIDIKEDRNQCYDNVCANAERGMPGNPLEKEIEEQEAREAAELEEDLAYYRSLLEQSQ